ncbi:MAG: radical SAM protein, partial [bacterium]|nr:radical SAM protein [bacterium]
PITPIALEYIAADLERNGYEPVLCDLTFAEDWRQEIEDAVDQVSPFAIGVTIRNVDDAYFASQDFILEKTAAIIRHIVQLDVAPVILGGIGFSCAPREVLAFTGAHYGIVGDGEGALVALLDALDAGTDVSKVPGAVFRADGQVVVVPPEPFALAEAPAAFRNLADNPRYFSEGGQAGIETKRGCPQACIYCLEPHAKGRMHNLRAPGAVADEFADLLDQGIDTVHLCDSEFNLPPDHARAVCEALIQRGLSERIRWYTYASPLPFDADLAKTMARAGCVGINFGVDHTNEAMLRRLGRPHRAEHIETTANACRGAGLAVMFDMLLGSPGETRDTIAEALSFMQGIDVDRVGLSCGVRVYPHTPLAQEVLGQGPLADNPHLHGTTTDNDDLLRPIFYVDAGIGEDIHAYVSSLIRGDKRFLHADPNELDGNYNYNDNSVLSQ